MSAINAGLTALCAGLDATALKEIIDTDLTDARLNNFLNMAYFATIPLQGELGACGGNDAVCEIIKVLAAHFLTMYQRQTKSESVAGEWSVSFMGREDLGLDASLYGQQAKVLDCSGKLAKLGLKSVLFHVADYKQIDPLNKTGITSGEI